MLTEIQNEQFAALFNGKAEEVHDTAVRKGFVYENKPEKIALMHSELSEALEAIRKDLMDDKLPHRKGEGVELADAVIRIMSYAAAFDIPLGEIIIEKAEFNNMRPHLHGGKQF